MQIARHLVEHETLEGDELQTLFDSPAPDLDADTPPPGDSSPDDSAPPDLTPKPAPAV